MAGETHLTIVGNMAEDPSLKFTPSGAAVANFTVMSTPRTFDKQANEWKDGETLALRCSIWRDAAENVAESLVRGTRVIVSGRLKTQSWEDKQTGQKRSAIVMDVDEIGPSLRYASAKVTKTQRGGGGSGGGQQGQPWPQPGRPAADPWAAGPGGAPTGAVHGSGYPDDEPPF